MEQYAVRSMAEYLSMMTPDNLPGFDVAIQIVIGIAVIVGFLVIFQSMYTAVMERTREIGILKSLGASKLYIVNVVLRETLVLAVVGIISGDHHQYGRAPRVSCSKSRCSACTGAIWVMRATDCNCRRCRWSVISSLQGSAKRSDRRVGLRVGELSALPVCSLPLSREA